MTEIRTYMVPVKVEKACTCVVGRMVSTGRGMWQGKHINQHQCTNCGKLEDFEVTYPYITHEPDVRGD